MVAWHNDATDQPAMPNEELKNNPFTKEGETAEIALVYHNGKYYYFVNSTLAHIVTESDTGAKQLGFFCERNITYTDWSYSTEKQDVSEFIGGNTVTATDFEVQVNGIAATDNKVLLGDQVTVSMSVAAGQSVSILVDGKAVETNIAD